ncbi:type I glyceraldehyde-3-phosphate dehydrogenase [Acetobacterium fimetarium]|uniref:Type I glyceraldehyde-3-phosphate dehydrogenase n=1 Tax=Acetobacterium fimetarium TaxID=52691 RepID=A0ABR6WRV4_9FIRM|nr:glyceraldehyde 3-phosphate dehydrogenase NAD-binding domain-containing protein [Acetobacterium fimetarium]MBC3803083.1 type I glyceraldehyde-3-phosphate dehydrogenase [Acetobacterium fimetarium]
MTVRIAINGFGRIGRMAFRQLFLLEEFEVAAINDIAPPDLSAYLLKFDTTQGPFEQADYVDSGDNYISVDDIKIPFFQESDASQLPWGELNIDIVLECSGAYLSKEKSQAHLTAGAKSVVISAPAGTDIPTIVYGVNENILSNKDTIISGASCSTNALAPMVKILNDYAPIKSGMMLVVHGYTATQMLQDNAQKKGHFRRSRAAAENIIPTTAEAATAVGRVIPELNGKLHGSAVRVPVPVGCLITFTAVVMGSNITADAINKTMKSSASQIFGYTEEEYVSSDIVGNTFAAIFDSTQTLVSKINDDDYQVRVAAWFDNENSFVSQLIRLLKYYSDL